MVRQAGKEFFFQARINAHHDDVQDMMRRIAGAQAVYSTQNNGKVGDLAALIKAGLVPRDIETPDSTGYRFKITVSKDGKSYVATAEPAQYGRTGKLSFYMDQNCLRSADTGGKPFKP
jgi:hypothetical protein